MAIRTVLTCYVYWIYYHRRLLVLLHQKNQTTLMIKRFLSACLRSCASASGFLTSWGLSFCFSSSQPANMKQYPEFANSSFLKPARQIRCLIKSTWFPLNELVEPVQAGDQDDSDTLTQRFELNKWFQGRAQLHGNHGGRIGCYRVFFSTL